MRSKSGNEKGRLLGNCSLVALSIVGFIFVFCVTIVIILVLYGFNWSGFGESIKSNELVIPAKTLWDWLELLLIPLILSMATLVVSFVVRRWERSVDEREERRAERREQIEKEIANKRLNQDVLDNYLDKVTQLLISANSSQASTISNIISTRTITVASILDELRKAHVLIFLYKTGLLQSSNRVSLLGANFSGIDLADEVLSNSILVGIDLRNSHLQKANLSGTNLERAHLTNAWLQQCVLQNSTLRLTDLSKADLSGANLAGANIIGTILEGANLQGATLKTATISQPKCNEETTLPGGEKWSKPGDLEKYAKNKQLEN